MGTPSRVPEGPSDDNMQKTDRAGRKISPMVKFVLLFLVFLLIVGVVFSQLITRYHDNILWLMRLTATLTGAIVSIFSSNVFYSGVIVSFRGFSVEIIDECTGLFEMLIYIAAVAAFSTSIRKKLLGMAIGIPAIFLFNLARIIFLLLAGAYSKSLFDFMHLYFWQATLIIMISSVWIGWLYLVVYREKRTLEVSS
jgi:archaeosortase B (VPXXXP-CTERM-specific)